MSEDNRTMGQSDNGIGDGREEAQNVQSVAVSLDHVFKLIREEIERAVTKYPMWPVDALHAVAVLNEEVGELNKAVLQTTYEPHKTNYSELLTEAIQTAAMSVRFLMSMGDYKHLASDQHFQRIIHLCAPAPVREQSEIGNLKSEIPESGNS